MQNEITIWISGGLLAIIGVVFTMVIKKLDKKEFNLHCVEQKENNKEFWKVINRNNELLIRVDERMKKDET